MFRVGRDGVTHMRSWNQDRSTDTTPTVVISRVEIEPQVQAQSPLLYKQKEEGTPKLFPDEAEGYKDNVE